MVDKEDLEMVELITEIIVNISLIITIVIQIIEKLCDIFKPGKHSKK